MEELYLVLVKENDLRLFTSYPQKIKEPIMVESEEEEQDYHGHFYHPYISSGKYKEVWQAGNKTLRLNPYYKDKSSYLKVVISDGGGYIVTKVTPNGKCLGIYQFLSNTIDFLQYYEICSKSDWDSAVDRLNMWFKDASLKIKEL